MTVSNTTSRNQYTATSGQTVFPYTFEILDKGDVVVLKNGTALSEGTNYTVSGVGNDNGGNITLTVGATAGDILTIYRDMAYQRTTDYQTSGDFLAQEVNDDFDRLWLAMQQGEETHDRALVKPITDPASIDMTLPSAADRANSYLTFDPTGAPSVVAAGDPSAPDAITRQDFTGDGSTVVYTLASAPGAAGAGVMIFIDGIQQDKDSYTITGTTLTFSEAPPLNSNINLVQLKATSIGEADSASVTYIPAGTGAVQTTVQSKLRETVSVKDFGAVGDGVTDDTAAIQAAIDASDNVFIPDGNYKLTSSLVVVGGNKKIIGSGMNSAIIEQSSANTEVIQVGNGSFYQIEDLTLNVTPSAPYTSSSAICLNLVDTIFNSSFKNLRLVNGAYGIYLSTKNTSRASCFSNSFDNLYIFGVSHTGIDIQSVGGGSTGNVFNNIYINFQRSGVAQNCVRGVFFSAVNESVFNQLNIESGEIAQAIRLNGGETLIINSLHLEAITPKNGINGLVANDGGFVSGTQNQIVINGMTVTNSTFDDTYISTYSVFKSESGGSCTITGLVTKTNTKNGTPVFKFYDSDSDANNGILRVVGQADSTGQLSTTITSQNIVVDYGTSVFLSAKDFIINSGTPVLSTCGGGRQSCWNLADASTSQLFAVIPEEVFSWNEFNVKVYGTQTSSVSGNVRTSFTYDVYDSSDALNSSGTTYNNVHAAPGAANQLQIVNITPAQITVSDKDMQTFRFARTGAHGDDTLTDTYQLIGLLFERYS